MSKSVVSRSSAAPEECIGSSVPELRQISLGSHAAPQSQRAVSHLDVGGDRLDGVRLRHRAGEAYGDAQAVAQVAGDQAAPAFAFRRPDDRGRRGAHHGAVVAAGDVCVGDHEEGDGAVGRRRELREAAGDVGGGGRRRPTAARIAAAPPARPATATSDSATRATAAASARPVCLIGAPFPGAVTPVDVRVGNARRRLGVRPRVAGTPLGHPTGARGLYESVGMTPTRGAHLVFEKDLPSG